MTTLTKYKNGPRMHQVRLASEVLAETILTKRTLRNVIQVSCIYTRVVCSKREKNY